MAQSWERKEEETPIIDADFGIGWDGVDHPETTYYNGKVDSVAVWNKTLSSSEVAKLWNTGDKTGYHLTTKEYDPDAGLYYFWQRFYDPDVFIHASRRFPTFCAFTVPISV